MTARAKNGVFVTGMAAALVALATALLPMLASSNETVREIEIVARGMAFYVNDGSDPNPAIVFRAGERVRVRVRNQDPGMRHDFVIKAWTVSTKLLEDRGEEDLIEFRVPAERGTQSYTCTPHAKMMSGTIRVE